MPLWRRPRTARTDDLTPISGVPDAHGQPRPLSPLLRACFDALDEAGVRWCLLRGDPEDLAHGARDVDLLVAAVDRPRLDGLFADQHLLQVVGHGRGRAGFFVGRDVEAASWVRLDVAVDLAYGPFLELETGTASGCLARLERRDAIPVLAPDDAFWSLVLHCILEKGFVAERHAVFLQALVDRARDDSPFGAFVASILPHDWDPARVRSVVRAGGWGDLVHLGTAMRRRLWRRDVLGTTGRVVVRSIQRGLGFGRLLLRRWGVSVALLGPDGAGKTTLAAAIAADFGLPVRRIYMGMWSDSQRGVTGRIPGLAILARPFAAWRKAFVGEYHRAYGRLVIFDRYTYDALIPPRGRLVRLKRLYFWFLAHAAPAPQMVIVLDAPGELLFARKGEFDPARLEEDRRQFRALGDRIDSLTVVDAARPPDVIRAEVTDLIWQRYLDAGTRR
jgi:thymidylate kinase